MFLLSSPSGRIGDLWFYKFKVTRFPVKAFGNDSVGIKMLSSPSGRIGDLWFYKFKVTRFPIKAFGNDGAIKAFGNDGAGIKKVAILIKI